MIQLRFARNLYTRIINAQNKNRFKRHPLKIKAAFDS